jgi:CheY-like chemotaxis protein
VAHTLLLADDSVTIQRVIELTFADENVKVVAVSDGDAAIATIDQKPPDIVLADVGMPGRDGYAVAQHVKTTPGLAHIPVVLLTGAFEPIDQVRASAVGCDGVLAKPFEPQLVIGRVKELLARRHAPESMADDDRLPAIDKPAPHPKPHRIVDDEYFEELDHAFAALTTSPIAAAVEPAAETAAPEPPAWFSEPLSPVDQLLAELRPSQVAPESSDTSEPVAVFPPLGDAFAALLAAEQASPGAAATASWPASAAVSLDVVDDVTRRVLEQMSERVVRETVSGIVTQVAERLVREEIERIKKSL